MLVINKSDSQIKCYENKIFRKLQNMILFQDLQYELVINQ